MSRTAPLTTMPPSLRLMAWVSISSPNTAFTRSPPPSTTTTSPGSAMSSALWIIRLSPGRLFTVIAAPPMRVPSCIGRRREPPAVMRHMQSLTFATGIDANACTKRALIFCFRARIWRPTMLLAALVWLKRKEGVATELVERRDAQQGHVARDLLLQEFDALEHAGLAGHGRREGEWAADEDEAGA